MKKKLPIYRIRTVLITTLVTGLALGLILWLAFYISEKFNPPSEDVSFGVTFSPFASEFLGLDWRQNYIDILDDLKVKKIRIPSYWNAIEPNPGEYDFTSTDFMVSESEKRGVKLIMTLGVKQPRWPECHLPPWVRDLSKEDRQKEALEFIQLIVDRYKNSSAIGAWQVENEPFFYPYGYDCYPPDEEFFKQEINLVRSLDSRKIVVTETGELASWLKQMQLSDIFGTTLYRKVWDQNFGYIEYPISPGFYSLKSNLFRLFAPGNEKTIVIELQAEPWLPKNNPLNTPIDEQVEVFPIEQLEKNIEFAKKTSFEEIYLWGVEWWYFMKERGNSDYWEYAKKLFSAS